MSSRILVWAVIVLAFCAANLPFLSERALGLVRLKRIKNLAWRLAELVLLYFLVGGIALAIEGYRGQIAPQGWEFYAITGALFITLAFPGFVYRYLLSRRS